MMSISEPRIRHMVEKKKRNARLLERLKSEPHRLLTTILIGNNLAVISASSLATTVSISFLESLQFPDVASYGVGITTGIMTLLILIFGEIVPKTFSIVHAEKVSLTISPIIQFFVWLFRPLEIVLSLITKLTKFDPLGSDRKLVTEDEVISIVQIGEEEGSIQQEEKKMIHNVLELDKTDVGSIMTPRVDMFALEGNLTISESIEKIDDKVYSRIPVYDDNIDKIVGIAYAKDILHEGFSGDGKKTLADVAREAIFIPESMTINVVLQQLKRDKTHIAIVVDEHGGIAGLVTIEDVLEELVGEIYDETDPQEKLVVKVDEDSYRVIGKINISDLNDMLELTLDEEEDYDTLSGLILNRLGEIPNEGDSVVVDNVSLVVSKVEEHRIMEVLLKTEPPPYQDGESANGKPED